MAPGSGNISFYTHVSESFKAAIGLHSYSWQTVKRRVTSLVRERRQTKHLERTGERTVRDPMLNEALDEWIGYIDNLQVAERERRASIDDEAELNEDEIQTLRDNLLRPLGKKRPIRGVEDDSESDSGKVYLPPASVSLNKY